MPESLEQSKNPERVNPLDDIDSVVTAKGSVYTYLPNGKTQRFKKVEGRAYEEQSILVYIPDFQTLSQLNNFEKVKHQVGESEFEYIQTLLGYVQGKGTHVYIIDKEGNKIETTDDALQAKSIWMAFGKTTDIDFVIPVSLVPKMNFVTYDTRKYKEGDQLMRERHIGNKVIKINKK